MPFRRSPPAAVLIHFISHSLSLAGSYEESPLSGKFERSGRCALNHSQIAIRQMESRELPWTFYAAGERLP
jgi:hypothetical protein